VSSPVARYVSSRRYLVMALAALAGGAISGVAAVVWPALWIAMSVCGGVLALVGSCLMVLALRPVIEIHDTHLAIGRRAIPWSEIRRLDQIPWLTTWNAPLAMYLTLADETCVLVVYAGEPNTSAGLLRNLRRYSREALLDGIPYPQFWGETLAAKQLPPPRYPLLRPEDEEEIERMFQRLKTVGRLDHRADSSDPE
jgi:hypothetical protein